MTARGRRSGRRARAAGRRGRTCVRACAERPRGSERFGSVASKAAIACADVERARDVRDGDRDGALRERDRDPERVRLEPSSPRRPNAASKPMPATAGGRTSGSSTSVTRERVPAEAPAREQVGGRRPEQHDQRLRDQARLQADEERISDDRVRRAGRSSCAGGTRAKIATIGSSRNASAIAAARTYATPSRLRRMRASSACTGSPRGQEAGCAQLRLSRLRSGRASRTRARRPCSPLALTTHMPYRTFGCAQAGILIRSPCPTPSSRRSSRRSPRRPRRARPSRAPRARLSPG